jgi:phage gp36-like protein
MYATPEDLRKRLDQRIVQYLSDELELGIENSETITSTISGASAYIAAILPERFKSNVEFVKELELLKAMAMLYRRFGYFSEASVLEQQIDNDIKLAIDSSVESGRTEYNRDPKYYAENPIVPLNEWRSAFEYDEF